VIRQFSMQMWSYLSWEVLQEVEVQAQSLQAQASIWCTAAETVSLTVLRYLERQGCPCCYQPKNREVFEPRACGRCSRYLPARQPEAMLDLLYPHLTSTWMNVSAGPSCSALLPG
jgi:hypothetical protein